MKMVRGTIVKGDMKAEIIEWEDRVWVQFYTLKWERRALVEVQDENDALDTIEEAFRNG